jgi:CHAD domain-containing protein
MAYCLDPGEAAGAGLKRVVREEADAALARIAMATKADRNAAIHEARKSVKKIRAVLRLMRPRFPEIWRREKRRLRDISRKLSELRDAAAMVEALDALVEGTGRLRAIRGGLVHRRDRILDRADVPDTLEAAAAAFKGVKRRAEKWQLHLVKFAPLEPGIEKSWRRSRRMWKMARRHPDPALWHEFRKRVKDHWYQARLLEKMESGAAARDRKRIEELEAALGEDHNLVVLGRVLQEAPERFGGERMVARAADLIGNRRRKLQARALDLGSKLYGGKEPSPTDYGAN